MSAYSAVAAAVRHAKRESAFLREAVQKIEQSNQNKENTIQRSEDEIASTRNKKIGKTRAR